MPHRLLGCVLLEFTEGKITEENHMGLDFGVGFK